MKPTLLIAFTSICLFASCTGNSDKPAAIAPPAATSELLVKASAIFQPLPATAENELNPITPAKVALGKLLYFDTRLSLKGNNSCNSCHNLTTFGVDNEAFSTGDAGKPGGRNSPTVFNAAVHAMQFWDGRSKTVEDQAGLPMMNPVEMAIPNKEFIEKRLAAIPLYQEQFKAAFPQEKSPLNLTNITYAIAAFERTLLTPSRFDTFLQGDETALTASEKEGLSTFMSVGCTNCHTGVGVGGNMMMKFGLLNDYHTLTGSSNGDNGLMDLTKNASDKDMFKVSSLRNVEKTGPYFHDGSVASLATAVKIMGKTQLNKELNEEQIKGIVSFLGALTADIPADVKVKPAAL